MLQPVSNQEVQVYDDVIYGIQSQVIERLNQRTKVLQTTNMLQLKKQLSFIQSCLPVDKIDQEIEQDDRGKLTSKTISLQARKGPICTYYTVGMRVEGGIINFYSVDRCNVRMCNSTHGDFLTFEGDNYPLYKNTYQSIMASTLKKPYLMISKTKLVAIGAKNELAKRQSVLQKFYVARASDNEEVISSGEVREDQVLNVSPMTMNEFDDLFVIPAGRKSTDPVEFVIGAVIKGVNKGISREDTFLMDGSSDGNMSVYTLNIEPEIFIYFEKNAV